MRVRIGLVVLLMAAVAAQAATGYVTSGRTIWTIAGNGASCSVPTSSCGDGPSAIDAALSSPAGVAVAPDGVVYIADSAGNKVRKVTPSGVISTVAGSGSVCAPATSACGDGGPGTGAELTDARGLALAPDGSLYIADSGSHRVRRLSTTGRIITVAGSGAQCSDSALSCGDGGAPAAAQLSTPRGIAFEPLSGDLYIADTGDHRIRRISGNTISTVAGTGSICVAICGDGGQASGAAFNTPSSVALDGSRNIYVADTLSHRVRKITASSGTITTLAGDGSPCAAPAGACGDGGPAGAAQLSSPLAVAVSGSVVYVADSGANKIRRVAGAITTVAGTGTACAQPPSCGDGGAATSATLSGPAAVAVDAAEDLFVADSGANTVRWLAGPRGEVLSVAETGGEPAPAAASDPPAATTPLRSSAVTRLAPLGGAVVRCVGSRCRILVIRGRIPTAAALKARSRAARRGSRRAQAELRRGGKRWAIGAGRTLAQALTLVPEMNLVKGRYRLRITQVGTTGRKQRDRIVTLG